MCIRDSRSDDPEAILEHFTKRHIPVTNVYRFPPHKETPTVSNPCLLLTFSVPFPPTRVKIGFTVHLVRPYIPHPRRCFKCHKFGHPQKYCRSPQFICPKRRFLNSVPYTCLLYTSDAADERS